MSNQMESISVDRIEQEMKRRNHIRKKLNIVLCLITVLLGTTATIFKVRYEGGFITCFREMTVCSTVLTTATSTAMIVLNLYEIWLGSEISCRIPYFFRLSSAVTEFIVIITVLIGFLPFFSDHPVIARYDMFNMHILIPLLTICSFIFNDSAIGKVSARELMYGLIIITIYAVFILTLILTNVIPEKKIPYSFLDVRNQPLWYPVLAFVSIYGNGYLLSWVFYKLNLKLSWQWYHDVAKVNHPPLNR